MQQVTTHGKIVSAFEANEVASAQGAITGATGFEGESYSLDYLKIAGRWEDHILTAKIRNAA